MELLPIAVITGLCVLVVCVVRKKNILVGEQFRKLLHLVCLVLLGLWVYVFPTWKASILGMVLLVI